MPTNQPDWNYLYSDLVKFVQSKIKDRSAAEDLVQDVLVKIHTRSSQLKDEERFQGWVFQIAKNAVTDYFRRSEKSLRPVDVDWEGDPQELNECASYCLTVLMKTLPEKYRVALELIELEGYSQYELSRFLQISHAGARSRVQRARKMLRQKMDELFIIRTDFYGNVIFCENRTPCCCNR
jgi:RNA polymerase sigma-70 factor (ECF subfamily)